MSANTDNSLPHYTEPGDDQAVDVSIGASSAVDQSTSVTDHVASCSTSAGARSQAQSALNMTAISAQAYLPLPQLVDRISPYTAVDVDN